MATHVRKDEDPVQTDMDTGPGWFDRNQFRLLKYGLIVVFALTVLGGFYVCAQIFSLVAKTDQQAQIVSSLSSNLDNSRKQLTENGITPTVPPAKTVVEKVAGEQGAQGLQGAQGQQGLQGNSGQQGPQGSPGPSGPPGPSGSPGANGQDGVNGVNGQDGVNGADGVAGSPGPTGPTGPSGPPGPQGTMPETVTFNHADGTSEQCTLQGESTYNCAPPSSGSSSSPSPSPTPTDSPSSNDPSPMNNRKKAPVAHPASYAIVERKRLLL